MNHNTTIPDQLQSPKMPDNPLNEWSDDRLKQRFARQWGWLMVEQNDPNAGYSAAIYLHALRDELLDRGISPVKVLEGEGLIDEGDEFEWGAANTSATGALAD